MPITPSFWTQSLIRGAIVLITVTAMAVTPTRAARTFDLSTAAITDINAAFDAGALTSEQLTRLYLARIAAYDKVGPRLNTVLHLNPKAIEDARALDAERRTTGKRTPLHGIPVLLKANIDVAGWPATAGFYARGRCHPDRAPAACGLRHSRAHQHERIRERSCHFDARGADPQSLCARPLAGRFERWQRSRDGCPIRRIRAWDRHRRIDPGTGVGQRGRGSSTDVRADGPRRDHPAGAVVGHRRPMAAHVEDLAVVLNVMVGPDSRDAAVVTRPPVDYTASLNPTALKGARLGLARDFMGTDKAWDAVLESAVAVLRAQGAEVVDVALPRYVPALIAGVYPSIRDTEFRYQIEEYLASLARPGLPRTHADIIRLSEAIAAPTPEGWVPNLARQEAYRREAAMGTLQDQPYRSAAVEGRKIVRDLLDWTLKQQRLDALIGPTIRPARLISEEAVPESRGWRDLGALAGWPEVVVPAGYTEGSMLPVGMSFLGPAFSEARLLALGHAFERTHPVRRLPPTTPVLPGERREY
jgi:amidase